MDKLKILFFLGIPSNLPNLTSQVGRKLWKLQAETADAAQVGGVLWRTFLLLKEHLNTSFLLGGTMLKFEGLVFGRYKHIRLEVCHLLFGWHLNHHIIKPQCFPLKANLSVIVRPS